MVPNCPTGFDIFCWSSTDAGAGHGTGKAAAAPALPPSLPSFLPAGTPCYMAPEVWAGRPYSYSSDMWSLGAVLYEMMTFRCGTQEGGWWARPWAGHGVHQQGTGLAWWSVGRQ